MQRLWLSALLLAFLLTLIYPVPAHALLKKLTPAQVKQAIKYGKDHQFSEFLIDRAYQFGPAEGQMGVLVATEFYKIAKLAAPAFRRRRPLPQEKIERITESTALEVRFRVKSQRQGSPFGGLFSGILSSPDMEFRLKQRGKVIEPVRVVPPLMGILSGGSGTYKVYFSYDKINLRGLSRLILITAEGDEDAIVVNFSKIK